MLRAILMLLFFATNAPGRSAFNRVERRMLNLSKDLIDVILPHNHFGIHPDKTSDEGLELQNFEYPGQVLAELWSKLAVDGYPVIVEFVGEKTLDLTNINLEERKVSYARESQYLLKIVKCTHKACCSPFQFSY